jgi:hypothetical protein
MCSWGTEKTVQITQTITVDACIADEIVALNAAGVHTLNSCCGHGRPSVALIKPSSADRARELGYSPVRIGEGSADVWEIVIGEGRISGASRHGDACMCDDCKLHGLELAADAREEVDRKARPEEVDRSQVRATPDEVEMLKRQVAELQRGK